MDPSLLSQIPESEPFRLLRIDPELWNREMLHDKPAPKDNVLPDSGDLWDQNRYADLALPAPSGQQVLAPDTNADSREFIHRGTRIPCVTGSGPLGQAMF